MNRAAFLSYRREDAGHFAGRLKAYLEKNLAPIEIFMDVETLQAGVDFTVEIVDHIASCDVLIAVIGPSWLTIADRRGRRRLENPHDLVALEIRTALERGTRVLLVLANGATMPARDDLPNGLQDLIRCKVIPINHEQFQVDASGLVEIIKQQEMVTRKRGEDDSMRAVFLSYRREDVPDATGRVKDFLEEHSEPIQVFMDVGALGANIDPVIDIERQVASCDALIAVIGQNWLTVTDQQGRRKLDDPDDPIVLEIGTALERGIRVVPLLVDGTTMPNPDDLPKRIEGLLRRQAIHLDLENFRVRVNTLIETIRQAPAVSLEKPSIQHDVAGARATYEQAMTTGDPEKVAIAALNLGMLLDKEGYLTGAQIAYQQAINSGHHDYAPAAALNLGMLLDGQGDTAGAQAAYQQAINSGHHDHAPAAALNLGMLLDGQGDTTKAQIAYQQAINSGHHDYAPAAALNLGMLLDGQGDTAGAQIAYQQAMNSGDPGDLALSKFSLGVVLDGQGDVAGAQIAYQQVINSGHHDYAPAAAFGLGVMLTGQRDVTGAQTAYQQVINSGHRDYAPAAARCLEQLK